MNTRIKYIKQTKRPGVGDIKVVNGQKYIRQLKYCYDRNGQRIGLDHLNGRQQFCWVLEEENGIRN